jgi:hypothetical protein
MEKGIAAVVQQTHGEHGWGMEDPQGQNPKRRMIRRLLARFIKEFTCVSRQMVSWMEADIRVGRPVMQIYNGIDTQWYRAGPGTSTETVSGTEPEPVPGTEMSSEPGAGITSDVAPGSGPGTETERAAIPSW